VTGAVNVTLNGIPVPLSFLSLTQITGLIPGGTPSGAATLVVSTVNGTATALIAVN